MDCEKLVAIIKRWGYNTTYKYLIDIYGLSPREVEECVKGIGIDLGYWSLLYSSPLEDVDHSVSRLSPRQKTEGQTSSIPFFV